MFPKDIQFLYEWRPYQARVIAEIEAHITDNQIHIVAAPGSGKTVLGLEIMRRLDQPTLVISPTLTIRNQWVDRFVKLFLQADSTPEWITTNVKSPKVFTSTTYQAVHIAHKIYTESQRDFADVLNAAGIKTLILDEAHHLRTEWWNTLFYLKSAIKDLKIIALTATPPYDVTVSEWEKYQKLCSTIDAEISVPELVAEKNLCPHQDLIYFNQLSPTESAVVSDFKKGSKQFVKALKKHKDFIATLDTHPFVLHPESYEANILENPEYYSSIVIFLKHVGRPVPKALTKVLGTHRIRVPRINREWIEVLLQHALFKDTAITNEVLKDSLKKDLHLFGAIHKGKVSLIENDRVKKTLKTSINKLESIVEIVKCESQSLKESLRMVVLTDFIAKEFLGDVQTVPVLNKVGVVTVFETIRRTLSYPKLGTLSGKVVIIPSGAKNTFLHIAKKHGIDIKNISLRDLPYDSSYARVNLTGKDQDQIVSIMTELFTRGEIEILVGTKSLLGEGWDAPIINTLVLASFVGSFMLSNQMRGRAIRIDPANPSKVGNIWHLASLYNDNGYLGQDYALLERRFKVFVGPDREGKSIENGIARLGVVPEGKDKANRLQIMNVVFAQDAKNRDQCRINWFSALQKGDNQLILPELETEPDQRYRNFIYQDAIMALLIQGGLTIGNVTIHGTELLNRSSLQSKNLSGILVFLTSFFLIGFLVALPKFLKTLWIVIRHGAIDTSLGQVSRALLTSMCRAGAIKTDLFELRVSVTKELNGQVSCGILGGSIYEKAIFTEALAELLGEVKNPRYIIFRKSYLGFIKRSDFHPVPACLGGNKEFAEFFLQEWRRLVGNAELIYTRTAVGRKALLRARFESNAGRFNKKLNRVERWR